ncbi:MAG: hypothetical protein ACRD0C_09240 [Acidimicrobiia bacterium]
MAQTERNGRRPDPVSMLTGGMRRIASMDLRDVTQALSQFGNPDAGFLDMLGRTREERVEKMAGLLRNCSEADMEEMTTIFALAMAKVAGDKAIGDDGQPPARPRSERPRRRRGQSAAEWREERRRAS